MFKPEKFYSFGHLHYNIRERVGDWRANQWRRLTCIVTYVFLFYYNWENPSGKNDIQVWEKNLDDVTVRSFRLTAFFVIDSLCYKLSV